MFIRAPQLGQVPRLASPKDPGNEEEKRSGLLEAHPEGGNVILRAEESGLARCALRLEIIARCKRRAQLELHLEETLIRKRTPNLCS